ncbi:hypothetical protein ONZ45_g6807 [Pleurotus djamor]|nr:hypothetical protein ONZ45_g6807 [Pleurotus djamor]
MAFPAPGIDVFSSPPSTPERTRSSSTAASPTHGDIVYPPLSETTREVFKSIVKGRKSWKTLRGNGEAVWPPELEAALLEGLESYQPDDSRETRLLGRFPMRNRYISDYIFRVTGKRRTAKQVGSRLQQLRDTCGGKRLLALLSPCRRDTPIHRSTPAIMREQQRTGFGPLDRPGLPSLDISSLSDTSSPTYSPTTPLDADPTTPYFESPSSSSASSSPQQPARSVICIDILPDDPSYIHSSSSPFSSTSPSLTSPSSPNHSIPPSPSSPSSLKADANEPSSPSSPTTPTSNDVSYVSYGDNVYHPSQPRPLKSIDPTVTFVSQTTITAESFFTVFSDNMPVYSESTPLVLVSSQPTSQEGEAQEEEQSNMLYSTSLVPGYWATISESSDPTRFIIQQEVIQNPNTMSSSVMFSAVYKFNYPADYIMSNSRPSSSSSSTSTSSLSSVASSLSSLSSLSSSSSHHNLLLGSPMASPAVSPSTEQTDAFTELSLNDYFMPIDASAFTDPFAAHEKQHAEESYYELAPPSSGPNGAGGMYEFGVDAGAWGSMGYHQAQVQHQVHQVHQHDILPTTFSTEFSTTYVL